MKEENLDEYDKLMLNLIDERINYRQAWLNSFRDRAGNMIQIDLLFIGIITALTTFMIQAHIKFSLPLATYISMGVIFPTISIILSLAIMVPVQVNMVDVVKFDTKYKDELLEVQIGTYIETSLKFIEQNAKSNLPRLLGASIGCFLAGLLGIIFIAVSLVLSNVILA
jgi:L-alanine-DL-glutamate epimerase-like enolase superfamily enzyme